MPTRLGAVLCMAGVLIGCASPDAISTETQAVARAQELCTRYGTNWTAVRRGKIWWAALDSGAVSVRINANDGQSPDRSEAELPCIMHSRD